MSVKAKYQPVLDLGEKLDIQDGYVEEEGQQLKIGGTTKNQYHKNLLWDEIKKIGGENPDDLVADIKVAQTEHFAKHTVEKGDTLSSIAKKYYGKPRLYHRIYQANMALIDDPNLIFPGQEITIPFPE